MAFWYDFSIWTFTILISGIGLWIILYYIIQQKKYPDIDKTNMVINANSEHTNNHALGWLIGKVERCKNGLKRIKYYPIDMTKEEKEENKLIVETAITDDTFTIKKGDKSGTTNIIYSKPDSLGIFLKTTPLWSFNGTDVNQLLQLDYATATLNKNFNLAYNSLLTIIPEMMKVWKGGEIGTREINKLSALLNEADRMTKLLEQFQRDKKHDK